MVVSEALRSGFNYNPSEVFKLLLIVKTGKLGS